MRAVFLSFLILLVSCTDKKNLEVFFNESRSFSAFENRFQQGYKASYSKVESLKNALKREDLIVSDINLTPDVSGYFYSYNGKKYKTEFYVFVLMYSESPSKTYEVVSLYFDEEGKLIWRNCTTKEFFCSAEPVPSDRGWFYDI